MIVTMQSKGRSITGIHVGLYDARRFFPEVRNAVDLELDDLRIRCSVRANSRLNRAEISDPRLTAWLEEKFYWQKLPATPVPVEMVRSGNAYRLQLIPSPQTRNLGFGLIA
jgi:hypothetical protein